MQAMTPQPIETAPREGGWVLGLVLPDGPTETHWQPWASVTWGDEGWMDDAGVPCEPVAWVPLPDPQPRATGWLPADGTVRMVEITGEGWTDGKGNPIEVPYRWMVDIERPDGSYDEYRDCLHLRTRDEAELRARRWGDKFGLPIKVLPLSEPASNVVPIGTGKARS